MNGTFLYYPHVLLLKPCTGRGTAKTTRSQAPPHIPLRACALRGGLQKASAVRAACTRLRLAEQGTLKLLEVPLDRVLLPVLLRGAPAGSAPPPLSPTP